MGWVVNAMVVTAMVSKQEQKDRQALMGLFSRHVSSQVAEAVWEQRDQFLEKGRWRPQTLVVTTLFTDLEGFTQLGRRNALRGIMGMAQYVYGHYGEDYYRPWGPDR